MERRNHCRPMIGLGINNRLCIGHFVIIVNDYVDTQYGETDYLDAWCVSSKKYCRGINTSKIRKFPSYEDAQEYIDRLLPKYREDREHEIVYLTFGKWPGDDINNDAVLSDWLMVSSTVHALEIDLASLIQWRREKELFVDYLNQNKKPMPKHSAALLDDAGREIAKIRIYELRLQKMLTKQRK